MAIIISNLKVVGSMKVGSTITSSIVTSGLAIDFDAGNASSYPGSGTTWTDISGNGFTATKQGTVPFTSAGSLSYFTFNGASGNYFLGNSALSSIINGTDGVTVTGVFSTTNIGIRSTLFSHLNVGGYELECGTLPGLWTNTLRSFSASNTSTDRRGSTPVLSSNVIYLMTWTWNQSTKVSTLYINGSVISSTESSTPATLDTGWASFSGAVFKIAADTYYSNYCTGNMYKVMAYSRPLSSSEVLQNFNALSARFGIGLPSGVVLNLNTDETSSYPGSGTTWNDISGNAFNATMSGGTVPFTAGPPGYFTYSNAATPRFNGNNSLASVLPGSGGITIIVVAQITNTSVRSLLFSKFKTTSPTGYILEVGTLSGLWTNSLRFYCAGNSGNSTDYRGTTTISANTTYMFSVTFDQPTASTAMYINNGVCSATQAGANTVDTGWSQGTNTYTLGSEDSGVNASEKQYAVLVFNRALSSTEITSVYNTLKPIYNIS